MDIPGKKRVEGINERDASLFSDETGEEAGLKRRMGMDDVDCRDFSHKRESETKLGVTGRDRREPKNIGIGIDVPGIAGGKDVDTMAKEPEFVS